MSTMGVVASVFFTIPMKVKNVPSRSYFGAECRDKNLGSCHQGSMALKMYVCTLFYFEPKKTVFNDSAAYALKRQYIYCLDTSQFFTAWTLLKQRQFSIS